MGMQEDRAYFVKEGSGSSAVSRKCGGLANSEFSRTATMSWGMILISYLINYGSQRLNSSSHLGLDVSHFWGKKWCRIYFNFNWRIRCRRMEFYFWNFLGRRSNRRCVYFCFKEGKWFFFFES